MTSERPKEPTEDELRAMDEAIERARAAGAEIIEGDEGTMHVELVGPERLARIKKALKRNEK
jgi:hypothetical protein